VNLLQWVLMSFLLLAAALLTAVGLSQRRRGRQLAVLAEKLGLRLSAADFMNLPARYARCLLMQAGHSAYARNIVFGRLEGCFLRVFDLHFEVGHATQRQVCRLTVAAGETQRPRPSVAIWRKAPAAAALVCMGKVASGADGWSWVGDDSVCHELAAAWRGDVEPLTLLTAGRVVLAACSERLEGPALAQLLRQTAQWVARLDGQQTACPA
jgi:hypothetical protein